VTLIVAHVSDLGAVMASDSLVTEEDSTAGAPVEKIWTCGGLLFGYSGNLTLRDAIKAALERALATTPLPIPTDCELAISQLQVCVRPVLSAAYQNFVGGPTDDPVEKLGGSLLVVGRDKDKYWLLEIDRNNTPTRYTDDGFHTIGSAALASHVGRRLLGHYKLPGYEPRHLCLLALRTVQASIDVLGSAFGIGGPVQLWQSTADGYERVGADALSEVHHGLEQWNEIERESLLKVFAGPEVEGSEVLPDALGDDDSASGD
jgi:hypothetical protein